MLVFQNAYVIFLFNKAAFIFLGPLKYMMSSAEKNMYLNEEIGMKAEGVLRSRSEKLL